jgi:hypothetical protein
MPDHDLQMSNRTAELAVLACCLQTKQARIRARTQMDGADFSQPQHEDIWDAMSRLDQQGMEIDPAGLLSVVRHREELARIVVDLVNYPAVSEAVDTHAHEVRLWATKRRMWDEVERTKQEIFRPNVDVVGLAAGVANRFAAIRDSGSTSEDIEAMTVEELMLEFDDEPDWIIPGFLERGDRFVLTGEEGLGKSHLLRQIVILASAGLDPFNPSKHITPIKGMVIDFENSRRQIRRRLAQTYNFALKGRGAPGLATILSMTRSDITSDRTLSKLHRELDACQPDVLAIGPLYRMSSKALNDDTDAAPILAALDTIRDRGIALLIEAHAGHGKGEGGKRDLRPRGSSALLGWPEFGYGMKRIGETSAGLVPWRGDRDERTFPTRLREVDGRWEEERAVTLQKIWATPENWDDIDDE